MHLTLLLLTTLSASALAAASSSTTNTTAHLEKRASYGWISSYDAFAQPHCNHESKHIGPRPKVVGNRCVKFTPVTGVVGVNWGTWPLEFDSFDAYTDDDCQDLVAGWQTRWKPGNPDALGCFHVDGTSWRSIKKHTGGKVVT